MNPEMERRIQEARDAGYSEQEIQAELAIMQGTAPEPQVQPQTPIDRTEEYTGLAQGMGLEGLKTAAELGGLYYGGKKLLGAAGKAFGGPGPVAPTPQQQTFNALKATDAENLARSAQPQQPGIVQRGMDYANKMRQIAAEKVMQNASTLGKVGVGAAAALTPGNIGQKYPFPTSGRFAGQEINPQTGRPWTPQEIAQVQ